MVKTEKKLQTKQLLSEGQVKISEILDSIGWDVVEADHQASVALSVERMCFHKVGSLVVVKQWDPVGLFTERDRMHRVFNRNQDPLATPLKSVMITPFAVGSPKMSILETSEL